MVEVRAREVETFEREGEVINFDDEERTGYKIRFLTHVKNRELSEASETLVEYTLDHLKIYTTKDDNKSEMWVYKKGIYLPQGRSEVRELLRKLLGSAFSMYYYNQAIAKIEADTFIDPDKFFKTNYIYLVPVQNGILNIKTREVTPFNTDMIFFHKLPVTYNPKAECPQIENFLQEVLSHKEDILVVCEIGGFALVNEYTFEKAFMFVGNGRNGKDKTLELIKRVIGVENCSSISLNQLQPDSFSISELFSTKLNLAGDISNKDLKDTSMFKALTGRSLIAGKRKFLSNIIFENYAKMVFACNELPMVYDLSKGFWDRWVLLEFPFTFVTRDEFEKAEDKEMLKIRDEDIISKITTPNELSGLLNKFLDGLDRLLKHRRFSSTKGTEEVKDTWIRKSNSFIAFCYSDIEEDTTGIITKKELRKKYAEYCKLHKVLSKSDVVIKNTLQQMYGASEDRRNMALSGSDFEYIWIGLKWK